MRNAQPRERKRCARHVVPPGTHFFGHVVSNAVAQHVVQPWIGATLPAQQDGVRLRRTRCHVDVEDLGRVGIALASLRRCPRSIDAIGERMSIPADARTAEAVLGAARRQLDELWLRGQAASGALQGWFTLGIGLRDRRRQGCDGQGR